MPRVSAQASNPADLAKHFGDVDDLLPLWIAEPYVDLAPAIVSAMKERAATGWYGYEIRPEAVIGSFWEWMESRHGWDGSTVWASVSPSVGTSIAVMIDRQTSVGDGIILQPPVFTDFKPLVASAGRKVIRNSLILTDDGYRVDLDDLEAKAADPSTRMMILCNPHNPVGRAWTGHELAAIAEICAESEVFVLSDEIHADIMLPPARFVPFASIAVGSGVRWAATHGPIKTFGLAGICDTLFVTDSDEVTDGFRASSSQFHLSRNNVLGVTAFETAYREGGTWLDGFIDLIKANLSSLRKDLPADIGLIEPESTYLAWLDFRRLGLSVPELAKWLASSAHLAMSPGHWFGREGAGFARMTVAVPTKTIEEAMDRLATAIQDRHT